MERELSWSDLTRIIEAYEDHHNYQKLSNFCELYYPGATKINIQVMQEYNDYSYSYTFGSSDITVWEGDTLMTLPDDDVSLLVLLARSPKLKQELREAKPHDPVLWLADLYYDNLYDLDLCGIEKGHDIEVDLTTAPSLPPRVYIKKGSADALSVNG